MKVLKQNCQSEGLPLVPEQLQRIIQVRSKPIPFITRLLIAIFAEHYYFLKQAHFLDREVQRERMWS